MKTRVILLGAVVTIAAGFAGAAVPTPAIQAPMPGNDKAVTELSPDKVQFFETKIRPIFSSSCYKCHSAEQGKTKGGLTLDTREGWVKGGEDGAVIVPGDPDKSSLIKAVRYEDKDLQMPPKGEKLTDQQIADLTEWVKMGAPDPRSSGSTKLTGMTAKARAHWSYQPVVDYPVPQVVEKTWVKTPVDAFILAKLESAGLKPSRPAPRSALIRRAYYDLIGLPPTPHEVEVFEKDSSPNAFEKVVDHLLASPHYGERWGRFWLDSARYADTTGNDQGGRRADYRYPYAWTYRDWVVKAFNQDLPYDEFIKEQLAADQMPGVDEHPERLAALGFITVGKRFPNPNDTIDERIDTVSKAMLGMTVACARCHDHKFDPIPQSDYYSLHGIFASTMEPEEKPAIAPVASGEQYAEFKHKLDELEQKDRQIYYSLIEEKSSEFRHQASDYLTVVLNTRKNRAKGLVERQRLIAEKHLDKDLFNALRFNRQHPVFGPLMWFNELDGDQFNTNDVKDLINQVIDRGRTNRLVAEAFKAVSPDSIKSMRDVIDIYAKLFSSIDDKAKEYLKACKSATEDHVDGFDPALVELIDVPTPVEPAPLITTDHLKDLMPKLAAGNNPYNRFQFAAINELELTNPGSPARAMAVEDGPRPHNSPVFIRGEANNRGPMAQRHFLDVLAVVDSKAYTYGSGRLQLARDIANNKNPLTARVMVNRIWQHHFGQAFVRTPDDLGVQCENPSHPELLDYLASRFMEGGWSIKKMHKLIMLSNVYQQSCDTNINYNKIDPENRLLWRANLRRLDFEAIRDTLLMFTGKMDESIGGKPVNLTDEPYSNRRSIYGYIDRGRLPELMSQFDFADPDRANSRRVATIVPQQALFFMNSPMAADVARKVVTRPEFLSAQSDAGRVKALYMILFQREPNGAEIHAQTDFFNAERHMGVAAYDRGPTKQSLMRQERAEKMRDNKKNMRNQDRRAIENEGETVDRRPLSIWEQYAQALLFTNEVVYVN